MFSGYAYWRFLFWTQSAGILLDWLFAVHLDGRFATASRSFEGNDGGRLSDEFEPTQAESGESRGFDISTRIAISTVQLAVFLLLVSTSPRPARAAPEKVQLRSVTSSDGVVEEDAHGTTAIADSRPYIKVQPTWTTGQGIPWSLRLSGESL